MKKIKEHQKINNFSQSKNINIKNLLNSSYVLCFHKHYEEYLQYHLSTGTFSLIILLARTAVINLTVYKAEIPIKHMYPLKQRASQ